MVIKIDQLTAASRLRGVKQRFFHPDKRLTEQARILPNHGGKQND